MKRYITLAVLALFAALQIAAQTLVLNNGSIVRFDKENPLKKITSQFSYPTLSDSVLFTTADNTAYQFKFQDLGQIYFSEQNPTITDPNNYDNVLYGANLEIRAGEEFVLPIYMRNTEDIISFQLDLYLPKGLQVKLDEEGYLFTEINSNRIKRSFVLESKVMNADYTRFVCYSSKNDAVVGTEGEVFNVVLVADSALADGKYEISYKNIVLTKADAKNYFSVDHVTSEVLVSSFMLGDVNGDGSINVSDVSAIVGMLLNPDAPAYNKAADVNSDGIINVSDVSAIVGMLLSEAMSNKLDAPATRAAMKTFSEVASSVFIEPFQINPGEEKEILVHLNNPDLGVISFQFDLTLPEGLEILYDEEDGEKYFYVDRGSRLPRSYVVESNQFANGTYRILAYSNKNDLVKETLGDIIAITVKAADTMADGIYTINFSETVLTNVVEQSVYTENTSCAVSVGNATGIEGVDAATARPTIYDLQGRPVDAKQRGVYIINNTKVVK